MNQCDVHLVLPGSLDALTGGTRYDRRVVRGLRAAGRSVGVHGLAGDYPAPDAMARAAAAGVLATIPDGALVIVDGLALGALPEVAGVHAGRLRLVGLVHHPLCDETGLEEEERERRLTSEARALRHVRLVVVTSRFTSRRITELDLVGPGQRVVVVEPGVDAARPSAIHGRGETFALLSIGALTPRKAYDDALRALEGLRELDWRWTCVGRLDQEPASASATESLARDLELTERVTFTGEATDAQLEALLSSTHLLVHPARYEGYGMAVAEALAHGIPVVASSGGALRETVPEGAGLLHEPGDVAALRANLGRALAGGATYASLRAAAERARVSARSWDDAVRDFTRALGENGA